MIIKLTEIQKERISRLENALKKSTYEGDLEASKRIIIDLQSIYTATGNTAKLLQAKMRFYEASMDVGNIISAEIGLTSVRTQANRNTRTHLEASVLLAICYLRMKDIKKAEPIIRDVLINDKVITSEQKRIVFRKNAIERFDQEGLLFALRSESDSSKIELDYNRLEAEAGDLIRMNYDEGQLFENIGRSIPSSAKSVLLQVDEFAKKQLPSAERIALPSATQVLEDNRVGKTLFSSVKRVLYKSICDTSSEVYKGWYKNGLAGITTYITMVVADTLTKLNISIRGLIVIIAALIMKFGIGVYCEHHKPLDIMELR